jgi:hypothetical protein
VGLIPFVVVVIIIVVSSQHFLRVFTNANQFGTTWNDLQVVSIVCQLSLATPFPPTAEAQWFSYCATNRKIAGSIPGGVIGIFH